MDMRTLKTKRETFFVKIHTYVCNKRLHFQVLFLSLKMFFYFCSRYATEKARFLFAVIMFGRYFAFGLNSLTSALLLYSFFANVLHFGKVRVKIQAQARVSTT